MSYYVIKNKYSVPGFLLVAIASWIISMLVLTFASVVIWAFTDPKWHWGTTSSPLVLPLLVVLFYTALGAFSLYMLMWVYWAAVERSSVAARIGWFLVLLLGLHYGAIIYAFVVWKKDMERVDGPQPLRTVMP
jgi:hypothetical protein